MNKLISWVEFWQVLNIIFRVTILADVIAIITDLSDVCGLGIKDTLIIIIKANLLVIAIAIITMIFIPLIFLGIN